MMNQFPYYRYNNPFNRFNTYNPAFVPNNLNRRPLPNNYYQENKDIEINTDIQNQEESLNNDSKTRNDTKNEFQKDSYDNLNENNDENQNSLRNNSFNLGPISLNNDRLSIFGFSIDIDDLLILGLILILLLDTKCNYALIIVLGLMFFNISFSSLNLF